MEEKAKKEIEELNKSLEQLRLKSPSNKTQIANKLFKIGDIYRYYLAKYDEALNYYEKSLEINRQTLPSNHPHIATTLNNIGSVYNDKGKYEEALCYYNQSLGINKQSLSPNHPFIATTLNNIGSVYYVQRKYSEALTHFIQSLEILKLTMPPNHPDIATTLNNIASVYKDQRKYDLSLRYFNESFEMRKQTLPSNHPDIAATLNNIGSVYIDEGKHEEALKHYNLSLELRRQSLPPNHPDILTTMNNIGVLYADQGRLEEALIFLKDERKKKECLKEILKKRNSKKIENPVNINETYVKKVENLRAPRNIYPISNRSTLKVEVMEDEFIQRLFLNRYKAMKFLGGGTFGRVYLVNDQMDSISEKAIKIMRKDETAENELNVITSVDHENIVRYYDHFELIKGGTKYLCIITEFCHKGDLSRRIEERKKFSEREIFTWTFQAVKGLKYLHSIGMIHRDIKPENILLSKDDVVKLGDLGVAKLTEATIHADTFTGTRPYMSPELFACENRRNKTCYSFNTDIWSLGCVLYEMMFFERTFPMGPGTNPTIPDLGDSLVFTPILKKMLLKNHEERIDSSKLYNELLKVNSFLAEI